MSKKSDRRALFVHTLCLAFYILVATYLILLLLVIREPLVSLQITLALSIAGIVVSVNAISGTIAEMTTGSDSNSTAE